MKVIHWISQVLCPGLFKLFWQLLRLFLTSKLVVCLHTILNQRPTYPAFCMHSQLDQLFLYIFQLLKRSKVLEIILCLHLPNRTPHQMTAMKKRVKFLFFFFEICTNNNLCVIIIFRFGQSNHRFNEHQFCWKDR